MNQGTLLAVYERLEGLIGKLPGPLQNAILEELRPIKQIFLSQRPARILLLGDDRADASALFSALTGAELELIQPEQEFGWVNYEQRMRGSFRVLDARRLGADAAGFQRVREAVREAIPDAIVFLAPGDGTTETIVQTADRIVADVHQQTNARTPVIGVSALGGDIDPSDLAASGDSLASLLKAQPALAANLVKVVPVSAAMRFRHDGSIDLESDRRVNIRELADLIAQELPDEAQVELARLFGAKDVQRNLTNKLIRAMTAVCAAVGTQPIPLADFPVLTALQLTMVAGIMHISGRELSLRAAAEFLGALGANIGVGMAFREGARAAVKLCPGWGNAISGGIAAAGTYGIGRAASAYFVEGLALGDVKKLVRRKPGPGRRWLSFRRKKETGNTDEPL
ncbi:MAG: hypothetical protein JO331_13985 [Verrucomicrobia bacterium]|nr:hypothetical protein [Verrucomicrobiota bacterium]